MLLASSAYAMDTPFADAQMEARAGAIFREIRCVVCQSETIADSHAEVASDMRSAIRKQLESGVSDSAIKANLAQQYGDYVLMSPPFKNSTFLLWTGPWIILFLGMAGAYFYFRKSQKP